VWAWVPKLVEVFDRGVAMVFDAFKELGEDFVKSVTTSDANETTTAIGAAMAVGLPTLIGKLSGFPLEYFTQDARYRMQWAAPMFLPQQSQLDLLYLVNDINDDQWECWTRAQGNLPNSHRRVRDAQQIRLNPQELVDLHMRGLISRDKLDDEMRKRGVLDPNQVDDWLKLRLALPTESDLVPFMTRDVVNPGIDWSKSDEWFRLNYAGPIAEWGKKLGIDPEVMKMRARQHWQLPSNTALYEMMARLRPGRRKDGLEVSYDDAKRLLQQNDMEPNWLEKILAISYLPPTRTDIKQGIKTRTIKSKEEAEQLLLDARIDPEFAPTLAQILWDDASRQVANESNTWSRAKILSAYRKGEVDRTRAYSLLERFMVSPEQINELLDDNDEVAAIEVRRECIKAVKQRVLRAELSEAEAAGALEALGISVERAMQLASGYVCYRASRGTELSLRYLSKIWKQGILSPEALYVRLRNLRYTEQDSQLILNSWSIELSEAQRKDAERELKERDQRIRGERARYRTEVAWMQKQRDRLEKQQKAEPPKPIDAVDTDGRYVPPNPQPPIP
jgi:hypothetical protein